MIASAEMIFDFDSDEDARRVYEALKPELSSAPSDKTDVALEAKGKSLVLSVSAAEKAAFRAAVSTYVRWVRIAHEIGVM